MQYANYQIEDFLNDDEFIRWVKEPGYKSDLFGESFQREYPHQQHTLQQARAVLLAFQISQEPISDATVKVEWERFLLNHVDQIVADRTVPVIPLRNSRYWWLAAAVVSGILIGLFWWQNQPMPDTIYRTNYGQISHIQLPDGSALTLNANSEVRLPYDWEKRPIREVWIRGEGFFHVVKRKGKSQSRFVVNTGELTVEVLGTRFNVRSRHQQAEVLLQTGSVRLRLTNADTVRSLLMRPGDGVRYRLPGGQLERRRIRLDQMAAWTKGELILDYMTLKELGQVIEDTYGRRVIIRSPSLARRVLSGSVPTRNEKALIEGIALTLNVPVHVEQNTIVFGE